MQLDNVLTFLKINCIISFLIFQFYADQYKNTPYKELIEARTELINKLSNLKNYFETPQTETTVLTFPNEDTQYKMYLKYLQSLIAMMI